MKKILVFGDSHTWGFIPGSFNAANSTASRYSKNQRYAGVMAKILGPEYEIIEEGLNGRNAILDDPFLPFMANGKTYLQPCLLSHYPLDLITVMLGTNELKSRFNLNASEIAAGIRQLIWLIKSMPIGANNSNVEILIISPHHAIEGVGDFKDLFVGAESKSKDLAKYYKEICQHEKCHFLDAAAIIKPSPVDGIHFDETGHLLLGTAIAKLIPEILGKK
ncbi:MAG: lipolytic protein family [Burkholderiales bacterium]|jgi:lysophospholipase L1-like esterase|nr:lipolytic protein family [Burkholderiales bacterium]